MDTQLNTSSLLAGTGALLALWVCYLHLRLFSFWSSRGIQGPRPWPIMGTNVYYIGRHKSEVDHEWQLKYGRVYGIFEGTQPVLRVTDNHVIKQIYIKEFQNFTDRNGLYIFNENMSRWLLWSKGDHWHNQRALVGPILSNRMKLTSSSMVGCAKRFVQELSSRLSHSSGERQSVVFSRDELMSMALDFVSTNLFGLKLDTYRDKASDFYKQAFAFANFDMKHFLLWTLCPTFICRWFRFDPIGFSKFKYFDQLSQTLIEDRRRSEAEGKKYPPTDMVQALIDIRLPSETDQVSDESTTTELRGNKRTLFRRFDDLEIRAQMTFFFVAGFDTTSSSLSFCFYELARQQHHQQAVYEQIVAVTGPGAESVSLAQLSEMPKLSAFINEALRLYAPVTDNDRIVTAPEGARLWTDPPIWLPKNTPLSTNTLELQRDPEYWPQPLDFDPDRFCPENKNKLADCAYMPFGLGPRNCAGMRLAQTNLRLLIANTLLEFKILPGPNLVYPPKFEPHVFFLQLAGSDFIAEKRQ